MTEQVSYTALKAHKNGVRLWIEGAKLSTAGFERGLLYNREVTAEGITLTLALNGEFKVSGRERHGKAIPIIDMALGKFDQFPAGTRIRAVFSEGTIQITIHHEDAAQARREKRFKQNMLDNTLTESSACTGGGISTAAIHQASRAAGFKNKVAWVVDCEIKYLQSAFSQNFAITDETVCFESTLEELETQFLTETDVFSFSLPCAGLSKSGTSKHGLSPEEHESGTSVFGVMNIIRAANPAVIYSENVKEAKGSPMYTLIIQELRRRGYVVLEAILDNSQTGTFENRQRYWFLAYSSGLPAECFADAFNFRLGRRYETLAQVMDQSVPDEMWSDNQYLKDKQVRDLAAGKGFATRQLLDGTATKVGTIGRHYNKRRSTEPFIVNGNGQERLLTVAEHSRVKSVPESLTANCGPTIGHEILGQGIDYLQAYFPAFKVMSALRKWFGLDLKEAV